MANIFDSYFDDDEENKSPSQKAKEQIQTDQAGDNLFTTYFEEDKKSGFRFTTEKEPEAVEKPKQDLKTTVRNTATKAKSFLDKLLKGSEAPKDDEVVMQVVGKNVTAEQAYLGSVQRSKTISTDLQTTKNDLVEEYLKVVKKSPTILREDAPYSAAAQFMSKKEYDRLNDLVKNSSDDELRKLISDRLEANNYQVISQSDKGRGLKSDKAKELTKQYNTQTKTKNFLDEIVNRGTNDGDFREGIKEGWKIPFKSAYDNTVELIDLYQASKRSKNGQPLSDYDKAILEKASVQEIENILDPKGAGYVVSKIFTEAPAFIAEYASTKPISAAVSGAVKGLPAVEKLATKSPVIAKILGGLAGATAQTSTGFVPRIIESSLTFANKDREFINSEEGDILIRTLDTDQDIKEAFVTNLPKGYANTWLEVASESTGESVTYLKKGIMTRFFAKHADEGAAATNKLAQNLGWNGIVGEVFEEEIIAPPQAALEGEEYKAPFVTPEGTERLLIELVGMGVMNTVMTVPVTTYEKVQQKKAINAMYKQADSLGVPREEVDNLVKEMQAGNAVEEPAQEAFEKKAGVEGGEPAEEAVESAAPTEIKTVEDALDQGIKSTKSNDVLDNTIKNTREADVVKEYESSIKPAVNNLPEVAEGSIRLFANAGTLTQQDIANNDYSKIDWTADSLEGAYQYRLDPKEGFVVMDIPADKVEKATGARGRYGYYRVRGTVTPDNVRFSKPRKQGVEVSTKLYRGAGGKVAPVTKRFNNVLEVEGYQPQLLAQLAQGGNKDAQKVLDAAGGKKIDFVSADKVIKEALQGEYDAVKYTNTTDNRQAIGNEYHEFKSNRFYAEKEETAKAYANQNREAKYIEKEPAVKKVTKTAQKKAAPVEKPAVQEAKTAPNELQTGSEVLEEDEALISVAIQEKYGEGVKLESLTEPQLKVALARDRIAPYSAAMAKKMGAQTKAIDYGVLNDKAIFKYGGVSRGIFTDGYLMILEPKVAGKINEDNIAKFKEKEIKAYVNGGASHADAEAAINKEIETALDAAKGADFPSYEKLIPDIKDTEKAEIVAIMHNGQVPVYVLRSDHFEVLADAHKLQFILNSLEEGNNIYIREGQTPIAFSKREKVNALLMPISSNWTENALDKVRRIQANPEPPFRKQSLRGGKKSYASLGDFSDYKTTTKAFHGTANDFDTFSKEFAGENQPMDYGNGFYFTSDETKAAKYAGTAGGNIIMEVELDIKNPADYKDLDDDIQLALDDDMGFKDIGELLKQKGFDGIAIKREDGSIEYTVYDPKQIKVTRKYVAGQPDTLGVLYHGTTAVEFKPKKAGFGIHFGTREQANKIIDDSLDNNDVDEKTMEDDFGYKYARNVVGARLNLNKLVTLTDPKKHTWDARDILAELKYRGYINKDTNIKVDHEEDYEGIVAALENLGYDGVVYDNESEGKGLSYIVFDPKNIIIEGEAQKKAASVRAGKSKAAFASVGEFATPEQLDENLKDIPRIRFPELVRLAKALTENVPQVKVPNGMALGVPNGVFYPTGKGKIVLNPSLFTDITRAEKTLAHEMGHLTDYLPDQTMARGNLLGRIASLRTFMRQTFTDLETETQLDTLVRKQKDLQEQRRKLKDKDGNLSEANVEQDKKVLEELKQVNATIKKLRESPSLTQEAVFEELKKVTHLWRPFPETIPDDSSPALKELHAKMVEYRYSGEELYADAISVLFNEPRLLQTHAPTFYKGFFDNLDTKPEAKKEFFALWDLINLGADAVASERQKTIRESFAKGEDLHHVLIEEKRREKKEYTFKLKYELIDKNQRVIDKVNEARKAGRVIPDDMNPVYWLEGHNYVGGIVKGYLEENIQPLYKKIQDNDLVWEDLGEVLFLERVVKERGDIVNPVGYLKENSPEKYDAIADKLPAGIENKSTTEQLNMLKEMFGEEVDLDTGSTMYDYLISSMPKGLANPFGTTSESAKQQLEFLEKQLGAKKWATLQEVLAGFRQATGVITALAEAEGFYKPEVLADIKTNPAYATFQVLDYLSDYIPASIKHQVGTLKDIANPADSTVTKSISVIRAIERNKVKKSIVKFMLETHPDEIQEAKYRFTGKARVAVEPKDPKLGLITVIENGVVKGFYVDKYIASTVDGMGTGEANAVVEVFKIFNNRVFRPMFITFNLGFQSFNLFRDFFRFYKNIPNMSLPRAFKAYAQALKPSIKDAWNVPDATIQEMEKSKILGVTFNDIVKGATNEDKRIDMILAKAGLTPLKGGQRKAILRPIMAVLDTIEKTGNVIERLPKIAGYRELQGVLPSEKLAHVIRTQVGSPDWMRRGASYKTYNEVFLFSNAIKEGMRSDLEVATDPRTRSGFWFKTAYLTLLPKLMMWAALMGFFGDKLKEMFEDVSEYDKTNYTIIPLGEDENGKTMYIRIPQDETGRFLGAIFWKALRIGSNNKPVMQDLTDILSYAGGQLPSINPLITSAQATSQYLAGKNPYDYFRGRPVIPDTEFTAGGMHSLKPFVNWQLQTLGISNVFSGYTSYQAPETRTWTQKVIEAPIASNIIGRWIKVSDYGKTERNKQIVKNEEQQNAQRLIEERRKLDDAVREYREGSPSISRRTKIEKQLIKDIQGDTPNSRSTRAKATATKKKFRIAIIKGTADTNVTSLIYASTNAEKKALLVEIEKDLSKTEYSKLRRMLIEEKIVSREVFKELDK